MTDEKELIFECATIDNAIYDLDRFYRLLENNHLQIFVFIHNDGCQHLRWTLSLTNWKITVLQYVIITYIIAKKDVIRKDFEQIYSRDLFLVLRTAIENDVFAIYRKFKDRFSNIFATEISDHAWVQEQNRWFFIRFFSFLSLLQHCPIVSNYMIHLFLLFLL